ncbi:hypothetical protein G9A89_022147 [Geosiphon pyriformis]|nr:hypothetical protein G9A89_022147 [Geosiphon pyriformis]
MSYVDSNASKIDDMIDDTTPKKTRTRTYVLGQLPKASFFVNASNNNSKLVLSVPKFVRSNQLLSAKSRVLEKRNFKSVKLFVLDVKLSVVLRKTNNIIRASFTSEFSLNKAKILTIFNLFKLAIESVFFKFGNVVSIKVQLIGLWQKALVEFESSEIADLQKPLMINKHEFSEITIGLCCLVDSYGEKTCFIGCNLGLYVHDRCTVVCFNSETFKLAAIGSVPVYKGVNLHWAGLFLACCTKCRQFGHISNACLIGENSGVCRKQVAQVASGFFFYVVLLVFSGIGSLLSVKLLVMTSNLLDDSGLANHMAFLEHSLELLLDRILDILKRLSLVNLMSMSLPPFLNSDMTVDSVVVLSSSSLPLVNNATPKLSLSSSKVLTTKIGGLKSKMMALEILVSLVLASLDSLCSGLGLLFDGVWVFTSGVDSGNLDSGVAIIMDIFLAHYVCKISEIPGQLLSVRLLFKSKLSISILGFYASASLSVQFSQAGEINSMITKAVNEFSFVVLGDNFNENSSYKCASFKKCLDLGLINSFCESFFVKTLTWANFYGVAKMINFLFIFLNLVNAVMDYNVCGVGKFFDTNHWAVSVSVGLVKNGTLTNAGMFSNKFVTAVKLLDLDAIWDVLHRIMTLSANEIFKKKWFKDFDSVFTKVFSRCYRLELLVLKIIKVSCKGSSISFDFIDSGANSNHVHFALSGIRKLYHAFKLAESLAAKEANIKSAINRRIKSFKMNKNHTIRSVLEHSFYKMVLDHLVVNDGLILEPNSVKSKVDIIMEGWTRKHSVVANISDTWFHQYWPLDYVFDKTFSGVMHSVEFSELLNIISNLPNGKAAGLLVLKGMTTQSPIFAIGLVVEDVLEKNWKLWLVLQDMWKAYDSTGIFSFFAASTFVDDTIWVGSSQSATQHIFDVASLLKPSLVKMHLDVYFFTNLVLKKAVLDKQFLYLVLKRLDLCGPVSEWFKLSAAFFNDVNLSSTRPLAVYDSGSLDIYGSDDFVSVCNCLLQINAGELSVYMNRSLKDLGMASCRTGAAVFFGDINLGLGVGMSGIMSFTLAEFFVYLFSDSQSALDACKSKLGLVCPDFRN